MALHLQVNFSTIRNDELVQSLLLPVLVISEKLAPAKAGGGNPCLLITFQAFIPDSSPI
jgi:hypothetical protein